MYVHQLDNEKKNMKSFNKSCNNATLSVFIAQPICEGPSKMTYLYNGIKKFRIK